MNEKEVMKQLEELIADRKSFIGQEVTEDNFYAKDKEAIETIIAMYENTKRELLNRDELLLESYKTVDKQNKELNILKQKIQEFEELDDQEQAEIIEGVKQQTVNSITPGIVTTIRDLMTGKSKEEYAIIESKYYILIKYLQLHYKDNTSLSLDEARKILKAVEGTNIKVGGKDNE